MTPDQLLEWLKTLHIDIAKDETLPDGKRVITFTAQLPFPSTSRVWYTLVVSKGQGQVAGCEIDALLRHCWHAEQAVPKPPTKGAAGPSKAAMNAVKRSKQT